MCDHDCYAPIKRLAKPITAPVAKMPTGSKRIGFETMVSTIPPNCVVSHVKIVVRDSKPVAVAIKKLSFPKDFI